MFDLILVFFFPAALLGIGLFLLYKGYNGHLLITGHGLISVSGKVRAEAPIENYVDKAECVYARLRLEVLDPKTRRWQGIHDEERIAPFFIDGEQGSYRILPKGADIDMVEHRTYQEGKNAEARERNLKKALPSFRVESQDVFVNPDVAEPYGTEFEHEPFGIPVMEALKDILARPELSNYLKFRKRAIVQTICPGDALYVLGDLSGKTISKKDILVMSTADNIRKKLMGRIYMSIVAGTISLLLAAALLILLI